MKGSKTLLLLLSAILIVSVITACGISKEEYENTVADLARTKAELEEARSKIAEMEKSLAVPASKTDIVEKLRSAQQKASDLSARVKSLTAENESLRDNLEKTKSLLNDLEKKSGLKGIIE